MRFKMEREYLEVCPICGADKEEWVEGGVDVISHGEYLIYRFCSVCNIVFQNPRPSPESSLEAYKSNAYREAVTCPDGGGVTKREVGLQSLRAQRIAHILKAEGLSPARFLDVGSSLGILTYQISITFDGCEAWGQEPSSVYRGLASEFEGTQFVETLEELDGGFDVITSIHCLEHMPYPVEQLEKLKDRLNPGGTLVLEVPDGKVTGGMSLWHSVVFSQETMYDCLIRAGFEAPKVVGMSEEYFLNAQKRKIPGMAVIAPKNGPYIPPIPQKPLTD